MVNNAPPVLALTQAPDTIREQSSFQIRVDASDDVKLDELSVLWNGNSQYYDLSADTLSQYVIDIQDNRAERLSAEELETLVITITDNQGEESTVSTGINVTSDNAPDASAMSIEVPESAFYGEEVAIQFSGLQAMDDGEVVSLRLVQDPQGINLVVGEKSLTCLLYTSPSPRDRG